MAEEMPKSVKLRVGMYQDDGYWVAHCVELDLLTAAKSREEAWRDIQIVCMAHFEFAAEKNLLDGLFRPPSAELLKMVSCGDDEAEAFLQVHLDGDGHPGMQSILRIRRVQAVCA